MSAGEEPGELGSRILDGLRLVLVVIGYSTPVIMALGGMTSDLLGNVWLWVTLCIYPFLIVVLSTRHDRIRARFGARLRLLADVLVLGILVAWGLLYDGVGGRGDPKQRLVHWAFAQPEIFGVVALHALVVIAYVVSRRRPRAHHPAAEPIIHALLMAGIVLHALIAVQLGGLLLFGLLPPFLPFATPLFTIVFLAEELVFRLRRRGAEANTLPPGLPNDSAFREAPPQLPLPPTPRVHRGLLVQGLFIALVVLGAWAVGQKALFGWKPLQVFTRTYGHTFSTLPDPRLVEFPE